MTIVADQTQDSQKNSVKPLVSSQSRLKKVFPSTGSTPAYWETSQNSQLSFGALGLHTYLMSLPDGWEISAERISRVRKEGRDAIRKYMRELREAALMETIKCRDEKGQFTTVSQVFATPKPQVTPETDFQAPDKTAGHTGDWKPGVRAARSPENQGLKREDFRGLTLDKNSSSSLRSNGAVVSDEQAVSDEDEDSSRETPQNPAESVVERLDWGKWPVPNVGQRKTLYGPINAALNVGWTEQDLLRYCNRKIKTAESNPVPYLIGAFDPKWFGEPPAKPQQTQRKPREDINRPFVDLTKDPKKREELRKIAFPRSGRRHLDSDSRVPVTDEPTSAERALKDS